MNVIVDAFGGDHAPLCTIQGAIDARKAYGVDITLVGPIEKIKACAEEQHLDISDFTLLDAEGVFQMETQPTEILKSNKNTSMAVGLQALADGKGDAFVSAGSTGALLVGATFIVKRIKGVKRPVIGVVMPTAEAPFILVDSGANAECTPAMLCQFARLGSAYMQKIMGVENPRVALANIGAEETKGTKLQVEAYAALEKMDDIHFTGNIEARDITLGKADVVVADGFTGNIILKMYEGVAKMITNQIKAIFKKNIFSMLSYLGVKSGMDAFSERMNYKKYGGAPIIGVKKTVIKAHGSSDAYAIQNAIHQAMNCYEKDIIGTIEKTMQKGDHEHADLAE